MSVSAFAETEAAFTSKVIHLARLNGWMVTHFLPARTGKGYRTPVQGHIGFCDLVLARDQVVLIRELKTDRGSLSAEQRAWLAALGPVAAVWRPRDWDEILVTLSAPRPR